MPLSFQISLLIPDREMDVLTASVTWGFPGGDASGPRVLLGSQGDGLALAVTDSMSSSVGYVWQDVVGTGHLRPWKLGADAEMVKPIEDRLPTHICRGARQVTCLRKASKAATSGTVTTQLPLIMITQKFESVVASVSSEVKCLVYMINPLTFKYWCLSQAFGKPRETVCLITGCHLVTLS